MKYKQTYQSGLSREQIDAYKSASEQTRREIEGSVNGSFEQDALDGWQMSAAGTSSMHRLDKKFSSPSSWPIYLGGASLAVIAVAGVLFFRNTPSETLPSKEKVELSVEQTDISLPAAIDTLEALPETQQIHIASIKTTQQELQSQPATVPTTDLQEIPALVLEPLIISVPAETNPKLVKQKSAKEVYYHDLKLIDYSAYRTSPTIETEQLMLSGTPANQESMQEATETTLTTVSIPYSIYIKKTMLYVGKGKWKESLQRLQLIVKTYPDDVNGHFYAGLCSYNLQQYNEAKQHFASCLQLPFSNFNEEASWYLAQSLLANGEKTEAKELFVVIRDQKGYYSKQAEKVLKSW